MILVLAGTTEGREMIATLRARGYAVTAVAVSAYGAALADAAGATLSLTGPFTADDLSALLQARPFAALVDCTHPFATNITALARQVCARQGVPYYRCRRPELRLAAHPLIHQVQNWSEAVAALATQQWKRVFLTIGTRHLADFVRAPSLQGRHWIARVLSEPNSLAHCNSLGLAPADVVALQGPCSEELNLALYRYYRADVIVTKDSGQNGGLAEKISAALQLSLPVLVIRRPHERDGLSQAEILAALPPQQADF